MVQTKHIRQMLTQAILACDEAEKLDDEETIQRLLKGAGINAIHASAEIQDELFRLIHGSDGYWRTSDNGS